MPAERIWNKIVNIFNIFKIGVNIMRGRYWQAYNDIFVPANEIEAECEIFFV